MADDQHSGRLWPGVSLHVVSGKGGTGKTTVAAALALALARNRRRTLLIEVEGRQGIAQLFDTPPLPYEERRVAVAPAGGEVWALAIDAEEALLDYLETFYNLRRAGSALRKMGAIDFVTTIAPGLRDVLLTGKAVEVVRRKDKKDANAYDAVIIDAPPTGRISKFLNVNSEVSGLAKAGPIRKHADMVMDVIASPQTAVHLVTLLEEMPVQETIDGVAELREHNLPVGGVFVNMTRPPLLTDNQLEAALAGSLSAKKIRTSLEACGLGPHADDIVPALLREANDHAQRVALERPRIRAVAGAHAAHDSAAPAPRRRRPRRLVRTRRPPHRGRRPMTAFTSAPDLDIDAILRNPDLHIIVCTGAGGVGKTTTAAALGLRAAEMGRDVCVLTIDPAKRLAQAMGLSSLDNTPRQVPGVCAPDGSGSLFAMMLDMKRTFDEVVESHADPARAEQILSNPFYQTLSSSFAGTQEYMAMEKLGQLRVRAKEEGTWDLIVVDTPPSRSALDFLDAPARLGSFLDGRFIRILTAPARGAGRGLGRLAAMGFGMFTSVLNKILGAQVLTDVGTFVAAIDTTFGGFRERADATFELLQDSGTSFVVVAAPERDALREAAYFVERLRTDEMPLAGLVLNRVQDIDDPELTSEQASAGAQTLEELAARLHTRASRCPATDGSTAAPACTTAEPGGTPASSG